MVVRDGELQSLDFNFENLDFIIYLIILAILGVSNFNLEVLALFFKNPIVATLLGRRVAPRI